MILYGLSIFIIILIGYSFLIEPNLISTNIVTIVDDGLFSIFYGKKVVQISDLHITSIGYREKKLVRKLNQIHPDILFITGDFLTDGKDEDSCIEVLRRIKMPDYGIWVILGNSDRWDENGSKKDITGFVKRLKNLGIRVLEDTCERLDLSDNGCHVYIGGVKGSYLSRSKIEWLLKDVSNSSAVILLAHYPDIFDNHTDALTINLEDEKDKGVSGWGWQDNAYFEYDTGIIRFHKNGQHTLRVQRREAGVSVEQICLVSVTNSINDASKSSSKKLSSVYTPINPDSHEMIVIKAADISDSHILGSWKKISDPTSNYNLVLKDVSNRDIKNDTPLLKPENYFETNFYAKNGIDYHVWVRMKAEDDSISSDSIYLQFNDSCNSQAEPVYRIGEIDGKRLKKIDLILAGHTHGGQVRFPLIGALDIVPHHKITYDMGIFENQATKMYVNRGIGTTVLPLRLLCPPEITVFKFEKSLKNSERKV